MSKKVKIFFLFIFLLPFFSLEAKDDKSRLSLGGGIYNFMEHGSDGYNQSSLAYNFELFSGKKAFKYIRPLVGFHGIDDAISICEKMKMVNNLFWPIPLLNIIRSVDGLEEGMTVNLRDPNYPDERILQPQNFSCMLFHLCSWEMYLWNWI